MGATGNLPQAAGSMPSAGTWTWRRRGWSLRVMKVLITGGAGFIGCHLARAHAARGDAVILLDNLFKSQGSSDADLDRLLAQPAVRLIRHDLTQPLTTSYNTGQPCRPLRSRGSGLGFSTSRDLFLSLDAFCSPSAIAEVSGGIVTGHFEWPGKVGGQNQGDVKEHPLTGNLWVGSPVLGSELMLAEFTET